MRDFYGKRRSGKRQISQAESASSALINQSESLQTHRFKVGPRGLQELAKKRKRGTSGPTKSSIPASHSVDPKCSQVLQEEQSELNLDETPQLISSLGNCNYQSVNNTPTRFVEPPTAFGGVSEADCEADFVGGVPASPTLEQSGILDPFNTLPVPNSPRTKILLHHGK
jgi:hypothetical protein